MYIAPRNQDCIDWNSYNWSSVLEGVQPDWLHSLPADYPRAYMFLKSQAEILELTLNVMILSMGTNSESQEEMRDAVERRKQTKESIKYLTTSSEDNIQPLGLYEAGVQAYSICIIQAKKQRERIRRILEEKAGKKTVEVIRCPA